MIEEKSILSDSYIFAEVIVPQRIPYNLTYSIPATFRNQACIGGRVIVQVGKSRLTTAIVTRLHNEKQEHYTIKPIHDVLDINPIFTAKQLQLINWISDYYMCFRGEVLQAAMPSGFKIDSESLIQLYPDIDLNEYQFTDIENNIVNLLQTKESLTYKEIEEILNIKNYIAPIKKLLKDKIIILFDKTKEKYSPKIIRKIRINPESLPNNESLRLIIDSLSTKIYQQDIVLKYITLTGILKDINLNNNGLEKNELIDEKIKSGQIDTLIKKNIFESFTQVISRFPDYEKETVDASFLNPFQLQAKSEIQAYFKTINTVLLHGITGSGKTEIYISLILEAIDGGNQVLFLLPEIALTSQIVKRLKIVFGNKLGVYHSKFSSNERVECWQKVASGELDIIVGVRSSVFLPFNNLGLIIVDEEHDGSYKQQEPAPRYHARDTALYLAHIHQAKVLLGSATPSLESYKAALDDKYGLVTLNKRHGDAVLPLIEFSDIKEARKRKLISGVFSHYSLDQIINNKKIKKQTIVFQNIRGYSPSITCFTCGWIPYCPSCDVTLTYHMSKGELRCHYCGHKQIMIKECPACGDYKIQPMGTGTQKIEEELQLQIPDAQISRLDMDVARSKNGLEKVINQFADHEIDILVGTQMVTKGLDFDDVTLVVVTDADHLLHYPDFRSSEKTFQLISQVSGRAGRRDTQGRVIVQSMMPNHHVLIDVANHDFKNFFNQEIIEREQFSYPPFFRLIKLIIKHEKKEILDNIADQLGDLLKKQLGEHRILGPEYPPVDRVRMKYQKTILMKLEKKGMDLTKVKSFCLKIALNIVSNKNFKGIEINFDVDPY